MFNPFTWLELRIEQAIDRGIARAVRKYAVCPEDEAIADSLTERPALPNGTAGPETPPAKSNRPGTRR